jgi:hypothetical protein
MLSPEEKSKAETDRLRHLEKDDKQWGSWNLHIHNSDYQHNRQYSAYYILREFGGNTLESAKKGLIHNYQVSLKSCTCPDFKERQLPCKHIYSFALLQGIKLPFSEEDFKKRGGYSCKDWPEESNKATLSIKITSQDIIYKSEDHNQSPDE